MRSKEKPKLINSNQGSRGEHALRNVFNSHAPVPHCKRGEHILLFAGRRIPGVDKHGTGCVLSASITANLALGESLKESCRLAKKYVTGFIASNDQPLGFHVKDYHLTIAN